MAKHRVQWSSGRYHRLIREGRGQGTLEAYKPWITIHDLASRGVVSRVWGMKTGRIHHFLSRNETAFFYILDASDKVTDIREQYPLLSVDETVRIAEDAGIRHPRDSRSRYPYVLTSDFVITMADGSIKARSVKLSSELTNPRVLEKLEIERRYWEDRGVEWRIVTEKQIDYQRARNLEWARRACHYRSMLPLHADIAKIEDCFLDLYCSTCLPVCEVARMTEEIFCLNEGLGLTVFQHLILEKRIRIDLGKPLDLVTARPNAEKKEAYSWIKTFA